MTRWLILIAFIVFALGCGGATRVQPKTAEAIVREQRAPEILVDSTTGAEITLDQMLRALRTKRVVYVGERHDSAYDHAVQYALLRMLHQDTPSVAVGMEMFQIPFQDPLDRWSAGEIDETVLRRDSEYDDRWGYDFGLYRPILEYARNQGLEVVALNTPREVSFAVARDGVGSVPDEIAAALPELDLDDPEHRAMFDAEFDAVQHEVTEGIDNYYQAQVVWDETMGHRVAATVTRRDGPRAMVVLAGRVHVQYGLGIPKRAARRGAAPFAVVIPLTQSELNAQLALPPEQRLGDFFWVVPE